MVGIPKKVRPLCVTLRNAFTSRIKESNKKEVESLGEFIVGLARWGLFSA